MLIAYLDILLCEVSDISFAYFSIRLLVFSLLICWSFLFFILHSWPLNNMGLDGVGPLRYRFFSTANATVLYRQWLIESTDAEPGIRTNHVNGEATLNYTRIFNCAEGQCPDPCIVPRSNVYTLDMRPVLNTHNANIFTHSMGYWITLFHFNAQWSWTTKLNSWPTNRSQPIIWKTLQYTIMQFSLDLETRKGTPLASDCHCSVSLGQDLVWRAGRCLESKGHAISYYNFQI